MRVLGIHHVAFAHEEGGDAPSVLTDVLGLEVDHVETADGLVERMIDTGGGFLQTLEPSGESGVIAKFVARNGSRMHHVALEVDDIDAAVAEMHRRGVRMVDEVPRMGGNGTRIAFLHPSDTAGLLVELIEDPASATPRSPG